VGALAVGGEAVVHTRVEIFADLGRVRVSEDTSRPARLSIAAITYGIEEAYGVSRRLFPMISISGGRLSTRTLNACQWNR